jgi:triosephosphate isomerase
MRKSLIAGNWKMNMTPKESIEFVSKLKEVIKNTSGEVAICVPFTSIYPVSNEILDTKIKLGAQNVYFEESGAYTGEISGLMLKDMGVEYAIVGHSERRELFFESDEMINNKVKKLLELGINPILCVGETLEEREKEIHFDKVKSQISACLKDVKYLEKVVIAYEPIWAIGTGKSASSDDAEEMCAFIRSLLKDNYGKEISEAIRIQYGGSVKPETIDELMSKENIDGALVGGASLNIEDFSRISNYEVING